jgi:zinc transport system substrate-binding protein
MILIRVLLFLSIWIVCGVTIAAPSVVGSISPIHAIVADVTEGVLSPAVLVDPARSPHGYTLRPSEARLLADADLVFWVGPELETFLSRPLSVLAGDARVVSLLAEETIETLPYRDLLEHDGHEHADIDPHIWLSLANARRIAMIVAARLSEADPDNAARYSANANDAARRYESLEQEIRRQLAPLADVPFMVFHDAYQYFEREMGLDNRGAVSLRPEIAPGVDRMQRLREVIRQQGVRCIFSEPQFPERLVRAVAEGSDARIARLDPLGLDIEGGPTAYEKLMREFTDQVRDCLGNQ